MENFNEFVLEAGVVVGEDVAAVRLAGELDVFTVGQLREAVRTALDARPQRIVIDLSDLAFIDMRGVHTLVELTQQARYGGVQVEIRHRNRAVERLAHLLRVDEDVLLSDVGEA